MSFPLDASILLMKYKSVIFDLFGTLTDMSPWFESNKSILEQIAAMFSLPSDDFRRLWHETAYDRNIGNYSSIEDNVEYICKKLGIQPNDTRIRSAAKLRHNFIASMIKPKEEALNVLLSLKTRSYKIGLISNCSPETPKIWEETPLAPHFDVAMFSCSVGINKPDPRIYYLALEQLAVEPVECLYVDDNLEPLEGALRIGMAAVLIRPQKDAGNNTYPTNRDEWDGPVISSLTDILTLLD